MAAQNRLCWSPSATGGRPGDSNGARPDRSDLRFRLYNRSVRIGLSDVLPMLEAMGLKVIEEAQYIVRPSGGEPVFYCAKPGP